MGGFRLLYPSHHRFTALSGQTLSLPVTIRGQGQLLAFLPS